MVGVEPDWYKRLMDECPPRNHTVPDWSCPVTLERYHRYTMWADLMGFTPMPWQRLGWAILAMPDCFELVIIVGRQEGKTVLLMPPMLDNLVRLPGHVVMYTAQTREAAEAKIVNEFVPMLQRAQLNKDLGFSWTEKSNVGIRLSNGSRLRSMSMGEDALRGETRVSFAVIDEARVDRDFRRTTLITPATTVVETAQIVTVSTAGHAGSVFLLDRREAALSDNEPSVKILEYGIPSDAAYDPADRKLWRQLLPALGYTVTENAIDRARATMEDHQFAMEYLGRWLDAALDEAVPIYAWDAACRSDIGLSGELCLAVDAPPEQDRIAAVAADSFGHVELIAVRSGVDNNYDWICNVLETNTDISTVALANNNTLRRVGERLAMDGKAIVKWYDTKGMHMASARFWEAVCSLPRAVAIKTHPALNEANRGSFRYELGGGGWVFRRQTVDNFASPLIAATLAHDAAMRFEETRMEVSDNDAWADNVSTNEENKGDAWERGLAEADDAWTRFAGV